MIKSSKMDIADVKLFMNSIMEIILIEKKCQK